MAEPLPKTRAELLELHPPPAGAGPPRRSAATTTEAAAEELATIEVRIAEIERPAAGTPKG